MPGAWKKAKLRGFSRLLSSDHRSKPKVDTDGDATLAAPAPAAPVHPDARNASRQRKPPRWLRGPFPGDGGAVFSTMATLASHVIAATTATRSSSPPPDRAEAGKQQMGAGKVRGDGPSSPLARSHNMFDEWSLPEPPQSVACRARSRKGEVLESLIGAEALTMETLQGLPRSEAPIEGVCHAFEASTRGPATPIVEQQRRGMALEAATGAQDPEKEAPEAGSSRGFVVLAKVLIFLVILVIVTKKIALGILISVLAALFVDAIGKRFLPVLRPCKEMEKSLDGADEGGISVSGVDQLPVGSDSTNSEQFSIELSDICVPDSGSEVSWEIRPPLEDLPLATLMMPTTLEDELVEADGSGGGERRRRKGGKTKKLFGKFVRRSSGESSTEREERYEERLGVAERTF